MTTAAHEVQYADLVAGPLGSGTRFVRGGANPRRGLDCKGAVLEILRRLGKRVPPHALLGSPAVRGPEAASVLATYLREQAATWERVPQAIQLGDVIVQQFEDQTHVSVLVDTRRKLALHATSAYGVHVVPLELMRGIVQVLRLVEKVA